MEFIKLDVNLWAFFVANDFSVIFCFFMLHKMIQILWHQKGIQGFRTSNYLPQTMFAKHVSSKLFNTSHKIQDTPKRSSEQSAHKDDIEAPHPCLD